MTQPVLANLKAEHQARFDGFRKAPPESTEALGRELDNYVQMLENMSRRIRGIDFPLVEQIAEACKGLLAIPETAAEAPLANAGVRYFLRKEDDYDETTAVLNFSDDVAVINAVCQHLGLTHLVIT